MQAREHAFTSGGQLLGTVLSVQANYYWVKLDGDAGISIPPLHSGESDNHPMTGQVTLLCTRRSRLKKIGQRVMVGDRVCVEEPDWQGGRGAIADVLPRQVELQRPAIVNVNQILLVFALADPVPEPQRLTQFLVTAEASGLPICLCFSKSDLVLPEQQQMWRDRLQHWGYQPISISTTLGTGLDDLHHQLHQQVTVVCGPSGVGKSSLINSLIPSAQLRVGAVSGKLAQGRHTTRHVQLLELPMGGLLADTPGFNQPDLPADPYALANYFPEIRQQLAVADCQFSDCLHRDEMDCAVRGDWERYPHYLDLLETAIARQAELEQRRDREAAVKVKTNRSGEQYYEPRLELKKYRRPSRRSQRQLQHDLHEDPDHD